MPFLDLIKTGAASLSASAQTMTLFPQENPHQPEPAADEKAKVALDIYRACKQVWSTSQDRSGSEVRKNLSEIIEQAVFVSSNKSYDKK